MNRKALSASIALLLGLGLVGTTAVAASAHTGDLNAVAVCDTATGEYDVTYTLDISQTGLTGVTNWRTGTTTFEGTPTDDTGLSGAIPSTGAGTITLGTITVPGTSTQAPWAYAFTTWSDGYKKGSDGGDIQLTGDCTTPPPASGSDVTETADCTTKLVTITTTPYSYVLTGGTWVKETGAPVVTTRPATAAELNAAECPPPLSPSPKSTTSSKDAVDCTKDVVNIETTVTTENFTYDAATRTWAKGTDDAKVTNSTRPLTAAEKGLCPPVLALTGGGTNPWLIALGAGMIVLGLIGRKFAMSRLARTGE